MDALSIARVAPGAAYHARVAYAGVLDRCGTSTSRIVTALRSEFGVSRRTAFRMLERARGSHHAKESGNEQTG